MTGDVTGDESHAHGLHEEDSGAGHVYDVLVEAGGLLRLLQVIATAANEAPSVEAALQIAVDAICRHTGWPAGHVYIRASTGELVATRIWHLDEPDRFEALRAVSETTPLAEGTGLPGQVLSRRAPTWVVDLTRDKSSVRARVAADAEVKAGFALPVLVGPEIVAVLEFFSDRALEPDETLLDAMAQVGTQLGRVVERQRAEEALRASEERFRALVQNASDVIAVLAPDGTIRYASPSLERVLGHAVQSAVGTDALDLVHPDDLELARTLTAPAGEENAASGVEAVELRLAHADGSWRHLEVIATDLLADPVVAGVVVHARDVTARKAVEDQLQTERHLLKAVLENLEEGVVACDADGCLVLSNRAARELHGLPDALRSEDSPLLRALGGEPVRNEEIVLAARGGKRRALLANGQAIVDCEGRKLGAVMTVHDVTERREAEAKLDHHSRHDLLTGLPTRALFAQHLQQALERGSPRAGSVAVLLLDVDRLTLVNQRLGHHAGDQVLLVTARRLQSAAGLNATVARVGGDEFAVLLENVGDEVWASALARRVLAVVGAPMDLGSERLSLSARVGIAMGGPDGSDAEALLRDAEVALRRAKEPGNEPYHLATPEMRSENRARIEDEQALRAAITAGELRLFYQPQVSLDADRITGVEALVRWDRPHRGIVPPLEFVPLAEDTGLIVPLGVWVLEEACRQSARWRERFPDRPPLVVSVNVSGRQFGAALVDAVGAAVSATGISPATLVLEVTETVLMSDVEAAVATLRDLKALGVGLSIDDFGTGYSSLAHLRRFPLDTLKIDRSFVDGLGRDPEDTAIVAAIVGMAHALGLTVVAEGVETDEQLDRLRTLGCEEAQGFYFARPQPAEALERLLVAETAAPPWGVVATEGHPGPVCRPRYREDTVVVADDAPEVLQLARLSLTAAGFEVHEAENGERALDLARQVRPECVVLDVVMPDMDGFEVCRALRADPSTSECTILILTANTLADDKVKAFSLGADDYIVKPFSPRDLVSRVRSAVRRRRQASP